MALDAGAAPAGSVTGTRMQALGLAVGDRFNYWFDFAADWWHQVRVRAIGRTVPRGSFPRATRRIGQDPPQANLEDLGENADPRVISGDEAADVSCLIGEMHLSKGDYAKAIEAFSRAIENRPTADAYYGRARAYRALAAADEGHALTL
jgi:tetratricopeptide (TPR) repeat protein